MNVIKKIITPRKFKRKKQAATTQRHTHKTAAGIEDALAITIDLEMEIEILFARIGNLTNVLRRLREGPHSYDEDRPAGQRLTIRRK